MYIRWSLSWIERHVSRGRSSSPLLILTVNFEMPVFGDTCRAYPRPPGILQPRSSAKWQNSSFNNPPWLTTKTSARSNGISPSSKLLFLPELTLEMLCRRCSNIGDSDTFGQPWSADVGATIPLRMFASKTCSLKPLSSSNERTTLSKPGDTSLSGEPSSVTGLALQLVWSRDVGGFNVEGSVVSGLLSAVILEQPDEDVEPELVCMTSGTHGSVETVAPPVWLNSIPPKTKSADGLPLLDEKLAALWFRVIFTSITFSLMLLSCCGPMSWRSWVQRSRKKSTALARNCEET